MKTRKLTILITASVLTVIAAGCNQASQQQITQLQNENQASQQQIAQLQKENQAMREQLDKHPANLIGNWKAEAKDNLAAGDANVTIGITAETNGQAIFAEQVDYTLAPGDTLFKIASEFSMTVNQILKANPGLNESRLSVGEKILIQTETLTGSWKQTDDYLIIERSNGGFVAFRISSQTTNQLTVFARTGGTIQFNRIP